MLEEKVCEYSVPRKDLLGNVAYAKCKLNHDDCWMYNNKGYCNSYKIKEKGKRFFYRKGNMICVEGLVKE